MGKQTYHAFLMQTDKEQINKTIDVHKHTGIKKGFGFHQQKSKQQARSLIKEKSM